MKMTVLSFALGNKLMRLSKAFLTWRALIGAAVLSTSVVKAAELVWIGGTGAWNIAGNWSPAQVPTATDNVFITNNGTYTVTVDVVNPTNASLTLGGASGTQTLSIARATLTLNAASVVNPHGELDLTIANSTINGAGNLTVNGTLNWANGAMNGAGTTTIGSGGVMAIGSGGVTFGRTLNHGGVGTWAGGNLAMTPGVAFNNLVGATFDITADGRLSGSATTPINNAGLFRQTGGTAGTVVTAPFSNGGTLGVLAATLSLSLGGTHTGTMNIAPGASLNFAGGSHALAASSLVTGGGALALSGGATTLTASGTFDPGSTVSTTAGVVTLSAGCKVAGTTLNLGGGILNYNCASSVALVTLTAGTLGGTSPVTVTGPLTLGGGTVTNALLTANGGLTINGNTTLNGVKLVNPGLATWSAGNLTGANGAVISNLFGATFDNTFDGNAGTGAGATPIFVNAGSFRKTGATAPLGTTSIDFQFINTGTVEVQTNTLRYGFNQQAAGLTLLDGGSLTAQAQPINLLGGSLVGTGLVTLANTQNLINSARISPGLPLGELDISGNYQQTAAGVLDIELGGYSPGTTFDRVTVSAGGAGGVATLGGTLNVTITNGFSPTNGASFTFLTALSRAGTFATFNYPSNDIGMQLNIDPTSATIKVTNLKPVVANPIVAPVPGAYGAAFSFQFPANTFADPDNDLLSYTASGMPPGITFTGSTRTFSGTPTQTGVFPVTVVANDGGTPNLTATNTFAITINPGTLTITAQPQSKTYGAADPALTYTVSGLQFSDTPATVVTGVLARTAGETVAGSPYATTQGTLAANGNYTVNFIGSTLTVLPATLTIAAEAKTKTYGAAEPALTFTVGGLQFGDTAASVLAGGLTRTAGETVAGSPYAITRGTLAANGNYTVSFTGSALTITRAALSITADAKTKTYGGTDPTFTATYAGFVNGETSAVLGGTLVFSRAPGENVGNYLITPSGLTSGNYTFTFNAGTLTITQAALSVTADTKTKTYGAADPAFTVTYAGFVNGDTTAALGGTLSFNRAPGENVGSYLITPSSLTSANYTITFNAGTLTITQAALSVTADTKTKTYGAADPAFTVTYAGLVNGDNAAVLNGTLSLTRAPGENVGNYLITPSGLTSANYTVTFNTATLTITRVALAVTADAKTKTYGAVDPAFTVTYAGFVNGDTPGSLDGTLSFSRAPGENVGGYLIAPSGLTSGNYTIAFNSGPLTIAKAALAVTANAQSKTYGTADPAFTVTCAGFVNSDTAAALGGTLSFTRAPGENVGSYLVSLGGLTSANYTITFNTSTLIITKAALSVTADAKNKTYGAADPAFTVTYAGFVNGDTATELGGAPSFTRAPGENVGSYLITPSGLTSANYTITFNTGTLTIIAPAPRLFPLTGADTANVVITWTAVSNVTYRVQYKSDLAAANWTDLVGDVTATGSTASKTDVRTPTNRYYRLQVLP
jgi:large repetitive protein